MKIGVFHDLLVEKGGAERSIIELANHLNADIITAGFDPRLKVWIDIKTKIIDIGNTSIKYNYMLGFNVEPPLRFFLNRKKFNYDLYIFSGISSIFASNKGNKNIWFCHSPNRVLYDLREKKLKIANLIKKPLYLFYINIFYLKDQKIIKNNIQKIIANSKNTQERIKKYYNLESEIIYPPINIAEFEFKEFGNFFLALSRLTPEKRMDLIAKAFTNLPDKNLILVGNGPEKNKILKIISGHKNIKLFEKLNWQELKELYSTCLATIYIPYNEDFGLVPLEGMASGKACIAANEGGCRETVINGKTGFLIEPTEKSIIKTIKQFTIEKAEKMKENCLNWAKNFDTKECLKKWENELRKITR